MTKILSFSWKLCSGIIPLEMSVLLLSSIHVYIIIEPVFVTTGRLFPKVERVKTLIWLWNG